MGFILSMNEKSFGLRVRGLSVGSELDLSQLSDLVPSSECFVLCVVLVVIGIAVTPLPAL